MIRLVREDELERALEIYEIARGFMRENGNPHQWESVYPPRHVVETDIKSGQLYGVDEGDGVIHGVFAFIHGGEKDYEHIEGQWKDSGPYGTIHRVASDGTVKELVSLAKSLAAEHYESIRIDTHKDNLPMQGALRKNGFCERGIIYLSDGSPRIAYEWIKKG